METHHRTEVPLSFSDFFRLLQHLHHTYSVELHRFRDELGLNDTDLRALDLLRSRQTLSPGDLARLLTVSSAGITSVVDRLESHGYVCRRLDASDRRRTLIVAGEHFPALHGPGTTLLRGMHGLYNTLGDRSRSILCQMLRETCAELSHHPPTAVSAQPESKA